MPQDSGPCPFCGHLVGEPDAFGFQPAVLMLTPASYVILNPRPVRTGAMLVIPRRHVLTLLDLTDEEAADLLVTARTVAEAASLALDADGFNLRMNNGAASGQTLAHCHLHVIPRTEGDGDSFPYGPLMMPTARRRMAALIGRFL